MGKKRGELGRKSQITLFIIIAVLLLFSAALFQYLKRETITGFEEKSFLENVVVREVSEAQNPVTSFVQQCLKTTTREAFDMIGQHGGYTEIDSSFSTVYNRPTDSDVFTFGELVVPYWFYLKSKNRDTSLFTFSSKMPELQDIEKDADNYVKNNLQTCLDDFKNFRLMGYDFEILEEPEVLTKVRDNDVVVYMKYPMTYTKAGSESKKEEFLTSIDLKFKNVYNLAKEIAESQADYRFLEYVSTSLTNSLSSLEGDIPPEHSTSTLTTPRYWLISAVKQRVTELLTSYYPVIRIPHTRNDEPINIQVYDPYTQITKSLADGLIINILSEDYSNIDANILYADWPMFFQINSKEYGIVGPQSTLGSTQMDSTGLNFIFSIYDYAYDISHPVLVRLFDSDSYNNEGYTFYYALESNIRNNRVVGNGTLGMVSGIGSTNLGCNPSQYGNTEITIETKNAYTQEPVEEVFVTFSCYDFYTCPVGGTTLNENNVSAYVGKFPSSCSSGGFFTARKEGYITKSVSSEDLDDNYLVIEMTPTKEMPVKIMKRTKDNIDRIINWTDYVDDELDESAYSSVLESSKTELGEYDQVTLILERIPEINTGEGLFERSLIFEGNDSEGVLELAPGKYIISTFITYTSNVTLTYHVKVDCPWLAELRDECEDIDEDRKMEAEGFPTGTSEINHTFSHEDIFNNNKIIFFTLTPEDVPTKISQLEGIMEPNVAYTSMLKPETE